MRSWFFLVVSAAAGCGAAKMHDPQYVEGFDPPDAPAGYTRLVAPAVTKLEPGGNVNYCQWVAAPGDADVDVLDVKGFQSPGGHHAVLYATTDTQTPIGTSRICTTADMIPIRFLGAIGGEGTAGSITALPPGIVFRLPKTAAIMINTHYVNASSKTIDVQSVIDAKFAAPNASNKEAAMLAVNQANFEIPAGQAAQQEGYCKAPKAMSLFMFTNHMHIHGTSAFSELLRADGTKVMLRQDTTWAQDQEFNPKWQHWDVASPIVAMPGDQFHVHCEWQSDSTKTLTFPDEMCAGVGFYLEGGDQTICDASVTPN